MGKSAWNDDLSVKMRVWIERGQQALLGEGRADLLAEIERQRSITKAAKTVRISYRKAWSLVQEMNQAAGEPLVTAAAGGIQGGGAMLTERGKFVLDIYRQVHSAMLETTAGVLARVANRGATEIPCIHLAASISLQEVIGQLLAEYALRRPSIRIRAVFGASNELVDHVLAGAPCDVFISAEREEIDRLDAAKRLMAKSRCVVASNGLAAIGLPGNESVHRLADLFSDTVKNVALAESACPLGRYTKTYLQAAGIYERLLPKVLHVDNSRAVAAAVISGAAEAGLAFLSDAVNCQECVTLFRVPTARAAAEYVAAVVRPGQQTKEAGQFLEFLDTPIATRCFRRRGFQRAK